MELTVGATRGVPSTAPGINEGQRLHPRPPRHPPNWADGKTTCKVEPKVEQHGADLEPDPQALDLFEPLTQPPTIGDPLRVHYMQSLKTWLRNNVTIVERETLLT